MIGYPNTLLYKGEERLNELAQHSIDYMERASTLQNKEQAPLYNKETTRKAYNCTNATILCMCVCVCVYVRGCMRECVRAYMHACMITNF